MKIIKAKGYFNEKNKKIKLNLKRGVMHYLKHFDFLKKGEAMEFEINEKFLKEELKILECLKNDRSIACTLDYTLLNKKAIKVIILDNVKNKGLEIFEKKKKKKIEKRV